MKRPKPFVLIVLDGWGIAEPSPSNSISAAKTSNMDYLITHFPFCRLEANGLSVGLPEGQMGNSEVGHLNLGAGRIVYQDFTRINLAIEDGSFFKNQILKDAFLRARDNKKRVHLIGLVSDGGVHSHLNHVLALLKMGDRLRVKDIVIHAFLDGRDTPPQSAIGYLEKLEEAIKEIGAGCVATISGRYYAMDRDRRWKRTKKAYDALVHGEGRLSSGSIQAIKEAYENRETDEFVVPTVIKPFKDKRIQEGDSVIFFNFRPDRARQITKALTEKNFKEFDRGEGYPQVNFVCFTEYDKEFDLPVAFPPERMKNILADVLAKNSLKQLRIAETEKYAHVTFFFNGGVEKPKPLEERILIPSPKVATYDLKPEMSAYEITERVIEKIKSNKYDFILINYANADMVGHTGKFEAAVKAIEAVDECVGRVARETLQRGGELIVTADHGNADVMLSGNDHEPHTAHSTNPVPFIFVSEGRKVSLVESGKLADVAPTVLLALSISIPREMSGRSLISNVG